LKRLQFGLFSAFFDKDSIRYIQYNGIEIIRNIYAAVRDENWNTIPSTISQVLCEENENSFSIRLDLNYKMKDIHFQANITFEGSSNNELSCIFEGKAINSFYKNRIGFCVLHPIKECAGKELILNEKDLNKFPEFVSPHQPFLNVKSMQWQPNELIQAKLIFDGDIFETEDQRNWTDTSFKTYCTPLSKPFPTKIKANEYVKQTITLKLTAPNITKKSETEKIPSFDIDKSFKINIPIGLGMSTERDSLSDFQIDTLKKLSINHLKQDVYLFQPNWESALNNAIVHAKLLGWKLECVLHFGEKPHAESLLFFQFMEKQKVKLHSILLLQYRKTGLSAEIQKKLIESFKLFFEGTPIGIGTDSNFAELNRANIDLTGVDFISFSINPQVHAFDDLTLIENIEAQADVVKTAIEKWKKPVHIHAITLKRRFNAVANKFKKKELPETDIRQPTEFCANWTIASIETLQKSGASSLTFFETVGKRGIMSSKPYPVAEKLI
jgi:hypothetical protein